LDELLSLLERFVAHCCRDFWAAGYRVWNWDDKNAEDGSGD
jgi:hypothetical protein